MRVSHVAIWLSAALVVSAAGWFAAETLAYRRELAIGGRVYAEQCASCHGANLEGQANWQSPLADGLMPAPPHDATGHTWHHSDAELFLITKKGMAAVVENYESDMPAFAEILSDAEITAVLSFIKSTWPGSERRYQQDRTLADND